MAKKKVNNAEVSVLIVKYNCGLNNHLTLRGEGAGLSWHHGTPLLNQGIDEWIFEIKAADDFFECKVLINDQVFEIGDNHKVFRGKKITIHPKFS